MINSALVGDKVIILGRQANKRLWEGADGLLPQKRSKFGFKPIRALVSIAYSDGNWTGLFINNKLVYQAHSIPEFRMLDLLKDVGPFVVEELEVNEQAMEEFGQFADSIEQNIKDGIL